MEIQAVRTAIHCCLIPVWFLLAADVITSPCCAAGACQNPEKDPAPVELLAIRGQTVYPMSGPAIADGVVLVENGKIKAVGEASAMALPPGCRVLEAAIVTPGLIDGHATAGLTGIYNQKQDQDQQENSAPIQPELRALDALNIREELIGYLRSYGITTLHTGHAGGQLVSGQTMIVKTTGATVDEASLVSPAAVVATIGAAANRAEGSPGTRGKQMAMLRQELIKAGEYADKHARFAEKSADQTDQADQTDPSDSPDDDRSPPSRDLRMESLVSVLRGELPLLVTANRAQDIATALRLADEFKIRIWLDGAAEAYLMVDQIKAAGIPVFIHPSMVRAVGEYENLSFETAARLVTAGIPVVMQSGFEGYVPKTRVVLFEAALTAANGLTFEQALATVTIDAAKVLGISDRVGTLEPGKDADLALYDGDPFEYTSHCVGVVINGEVVSEIKR